MIRNDLFARPYTPGAPVNNSQGFKVFRESINKYYVPRYYGESKFGKARESKLNEGDDVILEFKGKITRKPRNSSK